MNDERKVKDDFLVFAQLSILGRPYPKYERRRKEKKSRRSMLSDGYRDEVASKAKSLAMGARFNETVLITCHFYLKKGDGLRGGFDGKNLYANAEDALVDSGIIVDDNCTRVESGTFKVKRHGRYGGEPRTTIIIELAEFKKT